MKDRAAAKRLVAEFRSLPYAPSLEDIEAWAVLIDCLKDRAEDEAHARRIVDQCLDLRNEKGGRRMVTVLDIKDAAWQTRTKEVRPRRSCLKCSGTGWQTITRGEHSGVERCDCWQVQPVEDQPVFSRVVPEEIEVLACRKTMSTGERS